MADLTLAEYMKTVDEGTFSPKPFYCPEGDFVSWFSEDADGIASRIDDVLTVYKEKGRLVGVKIKQVGKLLELLGDKGMKAGEVGSNLRFSALFVAGGWLHPESASRPYYQHFIEATKAILLADALQRD